MEPVDDMQQTAWDQDILDWLAEDLAAHDYDWARTGHIPAFKAVLSDPRFDALPHRIGAAIPAIEIAHYTDPFSIGCPNRKSYPGLSIDLRQVRAKLLVDLIVVADFVQVHVQLT